MSFVLQYHRLFSVSVQEATSGALLSGFWFAPAPSTRARLNDHQLTFRPRPGGFEVFYRANLQAADSLLGRIGGRTRFTFLFRVADPAFFARHEPSLTADTGPQLYLDNLGADGDIQPHSTRTLTVGDVAQAADAVKLHPRIFLATAPVGAGGSPTRFTVRDKFPPGATVLEAPVVVETGTQEVATLIDLSRHPAGPYALQTDTPGTARSIYVDDELAGLGVAGLVDVYWETPQDAAPAGGVAYVIRFRQR